MNYNPYKTGKNQHYAKVASVLMKINIYLSILASVIFLIILIVVASKKDTFNDWNNNNWGNTHYGYNGLEDSSKQNPWPIYLALFLVSLVPLCWKIPMMKIATTRIFAPTVSITLGVCTLIFYVGILGFLAGIFLLLIHSEEFFEPETIIKESKTVEPSTDE